MTDRRILKTKCAIKAAFIELKSKKELNQITVKDLCDKANINKSTFYTHYKDIYDLSEQLIHETVFKIITSIPKDKDYTFTNPESFTKELTLAFNKQYDEISCLFSGNDAHRFSTILEQDVKHVIFSRYPHLAQHPQLNILLSYCIQGAYHAQLNNPNIPMDILVQTLEQITQALGPLYNSKAQ